MTSSMKMSKRINARLQLAAALIEADNEVLAEQAALEKEREFFRRREGQAPGSGTSELPLRISLPAPKLASESAIFAPYRYDSKPLPHQRSRTNSLSSRLSLLDSRQSDQGDGARRPSIDFLGVALPSEKKTRATHSSAASIGSLSRASLDSGEAFIGARSRPTSSVLDARDNRNEDVVQALEAWNVDKYLSQEERAKIEGRRCRANSVIGMPPSETRHDDQRLSWDMSSAANYQAGFMGRTQSEVNTTATGAEILSHISRGKSRRGPRAAPDPALLAKIKLYRARQETLPPSEWDGPGPLASESELVDHLDGNASQDAENLLNLRRVISHKQSLGESGMELARRKSTLGVTGSWSDEEIPGDKGKKATPIMTPAIDHLMSPEHPSRTTRTLASSRARPSTPSNINTPEHKRQSSSGVLLAPRTAVPGDPFGVFPQDSTRYPSHLSVADDLNEDWNAADDRLLESLGGGKRRSLPMDGLTTKQLQRLARHSQMPEFYGDVPPDARSSIDTTRADNDSIFSMEVIRKPVTSIPPPKLLKRDPGKQGNTLDPDMSSANWRTRGQLSKLANLFEPVKKAKHIRESLDDEFAMETDWRKSGPLQARGLEARVPSTLIMPQPLQNTQAASTVNDTPRSGQQDVGALHAVGIHVPPGFVLHDGRGLPPVRFISVNAASTRAAKADSDTKPTKKADVMLDAFLQSTLAERPIPVPATAPTGIGRRAASQSTVLFRNQLVQNEDEKEGWGWEPYTQTEFVHQEAQPTEEVQSTSRSKKGKSRSKRERKDRRRRREEGRLRRNEVQPQGTACAAVEEDSEDDTESDGSSDTSSAISRSSCATSGRRKPWVDDVRPAGKLYGKSLLDVAEARVVTRKSANMFYGQADLAEGLQKSTDAESVSLAPSRAVPFADRPLGMNDTRERMQTIFGKDEVWEREMQKRRDEDQQELQSYTSAASTDKCEAEVGSPLEPHEGPSVLARPITSAEPLTLDIAVSAEGTRHGGTTDWFAGASDHDTDSEGSSVIEARRSHEEYERRKSLTLEHALQEPQTLLDLSQDEGKKCDGSESDSSEDLPLDQLKTNRKSSLIPYELRLTHLLSSADGNSSDEEMPLAQIMNKRKDVLGELLHLSSHSEQNFAATGTATAERCRQHSGELEDLGEGDSDSDDDAPLGVKHPQGPEILRRLHPTSRGEEGSDDEPLGMAHPQAAIIAEQAALIKQLQAERANSQQAMPPSQWAMPAYPAMPVYDAMSNMQLFAPSPLIQGPSSDIGGPNLLYDPKSTLIDRWRNDVPGHAGVSNQS
ncbi:hypothetical protein K437DRAFT_53226 [Tilletiaria anomala UBC 951]|uniref:Uncharacterized protein n=1 Tax=Tilletiaria anomala (strain ATCC 24038 / CBS 436.72 / UBC 951) TaxID=1037660 RepID=A0A066VCU8_TILAU|nr:uncharacterized protein K437DRAFT_53226 [Tilletiaria anomala UBC 951]KDN36599.1 hypothetical protein K437DRAFT_53226 [Tilletiaria anomala UBC 951]